jgi:multidrug efflux pump subunit AcrA (membrane-fusion protein)
MRDDLVADLANCAEFRQTLQARPPRIVHGTALLLVTLLGSALAWAALTEADVVVRAPGQVRPVTAPFKVIAAANGEALSATSGGRVVAVYFREGDEVSAGQVLVELDTRQLDGEVARRERTIRAGEEELARLRRQEALLAGQFEAARKKAEAELAQARQRVQQARERQVRDIRLAELELQAARDEEDTLSKAGAGASRAELLRARQQINKAQEGLAKARLVVDESEIEVALRTLDLVARDSETKRNEQETRRAAREGEVDAVRIELGKLEEERRQSIIRAPIAGVVTRGDVRVGDILDRGKPVAEIAEQKGFRFEASVPSEEVGHLRVGMPARVKLDAFDYQKYGTLSGETSYIAPDAVVPAGQHTAVYTVKLDLAGDDVGRGEARGRAKLGMGGTVEIVTGRQSLLSLLVRRVRQTISLG